MNNAKLHKIFGNTKTKDNPWKKDMVHQKYGVTHYYILFQKYITLLHVKEGKKEVMMGSYNGVLCWRVMLESYDGEL